MSLVWSFDEDVEQPFSGRLPNSATDQIKMNRRASGLALPKPESLSCFPAGFIKARKSFLLSVWLCQPRKIFCLFILLHEARKIFWLWNQPASVTETTTRRNPWCTILKNKLNKNNEVHSIKTRSGLHTAVRHIKIKYAKTRKMALFCVIPESSWGRQHRLSRQNPTFHTNLHLLR